MCDENSSHNFRISLTLRIQQTFKHIRIRGEYKADYFLYIRHFALYSIVFLRIEKEMLTQTLNTRLNTHDKNLLSSDFYVFPPSLLPY
jgi:hypothetical protein